MKRFVVILIVFLLAFSLVACENVPPENATNETTNFTETGSVDVQTLRTEGWKHINLDMGVTRLECSVGEGGYYYLINGHLYFYDPATNISVVLCQKVGCLHENEKIYKKRKTCEAFIDGWHIFVYDSGYIYYDKNDHGDQLYRRNADGTGEMHIATLGENYTDSEHSVQLVETLVSDGFLYYIIQVNGETLNNEGAFVVETLYMALIRLDLASGKEKELIRVSDATNIGLLAAKRDAVVYTTMSYQYYLDYPNSNDRFEAMMNTPYVIHLWTEDANNSQELLCKPYRENLGVDGFENGVITSSNYDTGIPYTYDLVTGEYRELSVPPNSVKLNEQLYILEDQITIYNVQTGETLINEFADQRPSEYDKITCDFFAGSNDGILMCRSYHVKDSISLVEKESYISYVSFEALADGLHIQDAIEIMSEKYGD